MEKINFSIIIPVYNVKQYLEKCLISILVQNQKDVEVILVDDGSTDGSDIICDKYSDKYENIRTIHQKNEGLSGARNTGLNYANGKWILFLDSDDIVTKDYIAFLTNAIKNYKFDILIFRYKKFKDHIKFLNNINSGIKCITKKNAFKSLGEDKYSCYAWNKLYKKDLFKDIKYPVNQNFEDMATTYRLYNVASKIAITEQILYLYRQRQGSIVYTINLNNREDRIKALVDMYNFFREKYPTEIFKLQKVTIIEGMHFLYDAKVEKFNTDSNLNAELNKIISNCNYDQKELGNRFYIELFTFKHCKIIFNFIRKLTNLKKSA